MPYGVAQVLNRRAQVLRHKRYSQMAIITAAIGGKKANRLISLLEKQAKWWSYLADSKVFFQTRLQTRQYFQCRRWQANLIFRQSCRWYCHFRTKPSIAFDRWLYEWAYHSERGWYLSAQKKRCGIFYRQAKRLPNVIMCSQNQKTSFFINPFFRQMILFIHLRVPFVLYHNHSIDRVITSWTKVRLLSHIVLIQWCNHRWAMSKRCTRAGNLNSTQSKIWQVFDGLNQGFSRRC